jgi:hypothetical protein
MLSLRRWRAASDGRDEAPDCPVSLKRQAVDPVAAENIHELPPEILWPLPGVDVLVALAAATLWYWLSRRRFS